MDEEIENNQEKGKGCAVAAALLFLATLGFTFLAVYLRNSMLNYQPSPDQPKEGDMVSALAINFLFGAAGLSLFAALYCTLVIYARRNWRKKDSAK